MPLAMQPLANLVGKAVILCNQAGEVFLFPAQINQHCPTMDEINGAFPDDGAFNAFDPQFFPDHMVCRFMDRGFQFQ